MENNFVEAGKFTMKNGNILWGAALTLAWKEIINTFTH